MALDLNKIRQKVAMMSGQRKSNLWWPEVGKTYEVRILPWPDGNDGQPFKERSFYYGIGAGKGMLAPFQFNKPDPVQELIGKLRDEQAFDVAKKLYPRRKYFAPVIIRGEEDQGPRLWSLNKDTAKKICDEYILGEAGDITDHKTGRDLTVKAVPNGKKFNGKDMSDVSTALKLTVTPSGSAKQIKDWETSIPSLDDIYQLPSYEEIEKRTNDWINAGMGGEDGSATPEVEAGPKVREAARPKQTSVSDKETRTIEDSFKELDDLVDDGADA